MGHMKARIRHLELSVGWLSAHWPIAGQIKQGFPYQSCPGACLYCQYNVQNQACPQSVRYDHSSIALDSRGPTVPHASCSSATTSPSGHHGARHGPAHPG
uniref:Radical SAM protein n=1 Tax=Steinernema glaseri TaxID=37863 RepID=A0A1I7XZU0_9BILA